MFDPYSILNVPRDADFDAIRAAYRQLVKAAHPDAGGDPEAFRSLQRAHDLLTDEARRARYDATGRSDEPSADNPDAAALALINQMLVAILAGPNDPTKSDIVAEMLVGLDKSIEEYRKTAARLTEARQRCAAVRDRFHRRGEGDNALARMVDFQLRSIDASIANNERQITDRERAKVLLVDYQFEWDRPPASAQAAALLYMSTAPFAFGR